MMTTRMLALSSLLFFSTLAGAQEYGFLAGVHQTTAEVDGAPTVGGSLNGKFNFKMGLTMGFELAPNMRFRTGAIYNQRHFDWKISNGDTWNVNFDFVDVPANFQYNFNEMFGVFGGLVVGINVNDKLEVPSATTRVDPNANGLIPLADVGVNFLFEDMIGFDLYYERGLGKIADNLKNYGTFGGNFIYWF